jgi:SAM-dependent methyltransferase
MLTPGQKVLDVGCGYGRIAIPLAQSGLEVTGLDHADMLLQAAQREAELRHVPVRWVSASMCLVPLPDRLFDVALCLWSAFHELLQEDEQLRATQEIYRLLRPGGWCLIEGAPFRPATDEEIASGRRCGFGNRISMDNINGLINPHYCHDKESLSRIMALAEIEEFETYHEDWAGRSRQFLRFVKRRAPAEPGASPNGGPAMSSGNSKAKERPPSVS